MKPDKKKGSKSYADVTEPLWQFIRKNINLKWTTEFQENFEELK